MLWLVSERGLQPCDLRVDLEIKHMKRILLEEVLDLDAQQNLENIS
jgi:hypothetical protein